VQTSGLAIRKGETEIDEGKALTADELRAKYLAG
jgi:hypothetical protein